MPPVTETLFINKNARSFRLSNSRGSERTRIYSHVQRGPRVQTQAKASEKAEVLDALASSWTSELGGAESKKTPKGQQKRLLRQNDCDTVVRVQTDSATDALRAPQLPSEPQQLVSLNVLNWVSGDPFDSLQAPIDPYTKVLFEFCKSPTELASTPLIAIIDSSDARPRMFPIKRASDTARLYTLTRAFEDPLQRDMLLCTTSAAIYAHSGVACHGMATMTFKGRVLASLRQELSKSQRNKTTSFSIIYAAALLLYVECLLGNTEELAAHITGLRQLMHEADSQIFDAPLSILATLFTSAYLGAAILDVAPGLEPVKTSDWNQVSPAIQAALGEISTGPWPMVCGLLTEHADFLGLALLDVAKKQRSVMHMRYICSLDAYNPSPDDVQYIHGQEMAVEHQLTALRADASLTPAQHALRLALFIFPQPFTLMAKSSAAICRAMTKHLKKWLDKSDLVNLWAPRYDLLLWVLFVTAHISIEEDEWPWVLMHLSALIDSMGLQSVNEMEVTLSEFYYHPRFFRRTAEKIWAGQELFLSNEQPGRG